MNEEIRNMRLKFSCPANWDEMVDLGDARFCNICQKKVYDFTDKNVAYFSQVLAESSTPICGRFNGMQMAEEPVYQPFWKKWLSAALILIGINTIGCKDDSIGKVAPKHEVKPAEKISIGIAFPPPLPGADSTKHTVDIN